MIDNIELPEGWQRAEDLILPDRMTTVIAARWKQGKTNFALTAPDPIAHFNIDVGLEGVIEKFIAGTSIVGHKQIVTNDYQFRDSMGIATKAGAEVIWEKFKADYLHFLSQKAIRTLVLDTETEAFDLIRYARLGTLALPRDASYRYGPVNAEFRELIRLAFASDKNLVLVKKMKDEYVKDIKTGNDEPAGFKDTGYLVQVNLLAWRDGLSGPFHITIQDCRQNPDAAGMDLEGEMCTWDNVKMLVGG